MIAFAIYTICILVWGLSFLPEFGFKRSLLVSLCRGLWILPLFLTLNPQTESKELPRTLVKNPIHVLLDDSDSMKHTEGGRSPFAKAQQLLDSLKKICFKNACEVHTRTLSEENSLTKKGYTPLRQVLETWLGAIASEPWVLISDGGDSTPNLPWPKEFQGLGVNAQKKTVGVLVGVSDDGSDRLWIEDSVLSPIAFEGKTTKLEVLLRRKRKTLNMENVQVQVSAGDKVLISENTVFAEGEKSITAHFTLPSMSRGKHDLELRVLAPPGEKVLWDKVTHLSLEVVSNTLGVLHLLGGPSWDGRFVRRYLKSEPKYDLISFFILRDPWDQQMVDEREMSLIPFPVAKLFNEDLGKFKAIVLQNFNLLQFLSPGYQQNLVRFIKEGGSLLFIGGQRALQSQDLQNSPLRELLPFDPKREGTNFDGWDLSQTAIDKSGPWYDKELSYHIELAEPSPSKLVLANVYEEWALLSEQLEQVSDLKGLHHMENVRFKFEHTPLLNAVTKEGKRIPLAIASYPGKGRAIWFFTDQLWRLAVDPHNEVSRTVYNSLMESSFSWLMRNDFRKPISLSRFQLQSWGNQEPVDWSVNFEGPAVRYFEAEKPWSLNVCGNQLDLHKIAKMKLGSSQMTLSGTLESHLLKSNACTLELRGEHPSFGSLSENITSNVPDILKDAGVGVSEFKMKQLADLTGAHLLSLDQSEKALDYLEEWIGERTGGQGVYLPPRFRTLVNHYWVLDMWWFYILLIFLPFEVLVRRWPKLRA